MKGVMVRLAGEVGSVTNAGSTPAWVQARLTAASEMDRRLEHGAGVPECRLKLLTPSPSLDENSLNSSLE